MEHLAKNLEQLQQRGTVWNRIGTFHLTEGTNRNIKNNILEHLAENLEQLQQRGTVWNRIR